MVKAVVEVNNISKVYKMEEVEVPALMNVSLTIKTGEFVSIVGKSGSGKSTLMHIIGALDRPTTGSVVVNGRDISKMNEAQLASLRNKEIGFVFQAFNLLKRTTALDNVELPLIYANIHEKERIKKAKEMLIKVGLEDRMHHLPNQLSGGQQQRVAIARALINDPSIILADEPTGNLDSKSGRAILDILENLNREGKTVIIVTHDMEVAREAKRIIKIVDGRITS
ncbi:macrolide ABC transporter ATP-binding protein [candidate division WWE3 bacterium CG08_land_8_20_14_0_20_40_13]|uniref:Macrolide ABC transporter ATP-binding protein n=1 Tax=candidate division WWE3 bacterium CG08_land_8_20_14_0_20_40_13 TaxID=1975084 RepID=A0A2H0XE35_UNCKA|nr:MAG: macrolide ABC transporter ATP-binding protein [candidate division WWE3 bacterium CG08_land_8_20_14_0_20_40_13]